MTYVLGFRQPSMNAIISDARGSWKGKDGKWYGENNILKTGLLFPGCIYGIIGNLALADDLILSFKESIGEERDTEVLWQRFNKVVGCGGFAAGGAEHFQILLSKRSSTGPDLLILDSANGISPIQPNAPYSIHSFGSGKKILESLHNRVGGENHAKNVLF